MVHWAVNYSKRWYKIFFYYWFFCLLWKLHVTKNRFLCFWLLFFLSLHYQRMTCKEHQLHIASSLLSLCFFYEAPLIIDSKLPSDAKGNNDLFVIRLLLRFFGFCLPSGTQVHPFSGLLTDSTRRHHVTQYESMFKLLSLCSYVNVRACLAHVSPVATAWFEK